MRIVWLIVVMLSLGSLAVLPGCAELDELTGALDEAGIELPSEPGRAHRLQGTVSATRVGRGYTWKATASMDLERTPSGWRGTDDFTDDKSVELEGMRDHESHQVAGSGQTMGTFVLRDNDDGTCTISFSHGSIRLQESERHGSKWVDFESTRGNHTYTVENIPMSRPEGGFSGSEAYTSVDGAEEYTLSWSFVPK